MAGRVGARPPSGVPSLSDLSILSQRERRLMRMRFGLGGQVPQTLSEVGKALGVGTERARQIQNTALRKLQYGRVVDAASADGKRPNRSRPDPKKQAVARAFGHASRRAILRELIRRGGTPVTPKELAAMFDQVPTHFVDHAEALARLGAIELVREGYYAPLGPPGKRFYRLSPSWVRDPRTRAALSALARERT